MHQQPSLSAGKPESMQQLPLGDGVIYGESLAESFSSLRLSPKPVLVASSRGEQ
jgi:hypothetical protein